MKEIASRTARSAAAVEPLLLSPCSVQAREWHATRGCNLGSGVGRGGVTADTHVPRRDSRSQPKPHCTKRRRLSFSCGAARFAPRPTRAHSSERGLILVERERAPASGVRSAIGSLPPTCMVTSYRMWPRLSVVPHARAWWQLVCERGVKHLPPPDARPYEPSAATTCVPSLVVYGLGVTRRPCGACSAHTSPISPCFHQIVKLAAHAY